MADSQQAQDGGEQQRVLQQTQHTVVKLLHHINTLDVDSLENPESKGHFASVFGEKETVLSALTKLTQLMHKLCDLEQSLQVRQTRQALSEAPSSEAQATIDTGIIDRYLQKQGYVTPKNTAKSVKKD